VKIPKDAIVSNSDIIKYYKAQRDRVEIHGKLFIFKNNQPDAVLFSIDAYEKVSDYLELLETMNEEERAKLLQMILEHRRRINI
jgi:PHD/YefM family antitoxin component YafN of YafNO toxin-antitoxin module